MRRKWLIDAHNLMHKLPHASGAYGRNRLEGISIVIQCINQLCHKYNRQAQLVFDGHKINIPDKPDGIVVQFSGNKPADVVIRNILQKRTSNNKWTVISDDHEVKSYARQAGCDVIAVSDITSEFNPETGATNTQSKKPHPGEDPKINLSDDEVDEWKDIFGID